MCEEKLLCEDREMLGERGPFSSYRRPACDDSRLCRDNAVVQEGMEGRPCRAEGGAFSLKAGPAKDAGRSERAGPENIMAGGQK